jgi:hypothetical protein
MKRQIWVILTLALVAYSSVSSKDGEDYTTTPLINSDLIVLTLYSLDKID